VIKIQFSGWFQARFATDHDPHTHLRGDRGWTFAMPGEPDFDRVIRFTQPVAPRSRGPLVGVRVVDVTVGGTAVAGHALRDAPVELLDGPKFEGHKGKIAQTGEEPIYPLRMRIAAAGGLSFETLEWLKFSDLYLPMKVIPRQAKRTIPPLNPAQLTSLLGAPSAAQYREARRVALVEDLANEKDPVKCAALQKRIDELDPQARWNGFATTVLPTRMQYSTEIPEHCCKFLDPHGAWRLADPRPMKWTCQWWMGAWDADSLCGYVDGSLDLVPR
jgi:hypothetical protein